MCRKRFGCILNTALPELTYKVSPFSYREKIELNSSSPAEDINVTLAQKMERLSLLILLCIFVISACKKEGEFVHATIYDESTMLAGCGWVVEISSEFFLPKNLPDEFKVGGLEVEIKYDELTSQGLCQLHQDGIYEISIIEIRELIK